MDQRQYEEFQPQFDWLKDDTSNTLLIDVSGFTREQLRLQLDRTGNLKIGGERQLAGNKWSRFKADIPVPKNSNVQAIRAKFENGILHVLIPKLITGVTEPVEPPQTPQAKEEPKKQEPKAEVKPTSPQPKEEIKAQEAQTVVKESTPPTPIPQKKEESTPKAQLTQPKDAKAQGAQNDRMQTEEVQKPTEKQHGAMSNELAEESKEVRPLGKTNGSKQEGGGHADEKGTTGEEMRMPSKKDNGLVDSAGGLKDGLNNQRQLIVNALVSGLVVTGLGIYLFNKFRSSPGDN